MAGFIDGRGVTGGRHADPLKDDRAHRRAMRALFLAAGAALALALGPAGIASADAAGLGAGTLQPAIVGGSPISVPKAPWAVKVEEIVPAAGGGQPTVFVCGGSILSATQVLTAAHCVFSESTEVPAGDLLVTAGTSDFNKPEAEAEQRAVSAVRVHPDYASNPAATEDIPDDVAVLTLGEALTLGPAIKPIVLAPAGSLFPEGMLVNVAGFGQENPVTKELNGTLNSITMNLVFSRDCGGQADAVFVCARTQTGSVCFGDSGSGLTIPGSPATPTMKATPVTLLGVTDTVEEKCADNALAGFANVTAPEIRDFIEGDETPPLAPRGGGSTLVGIPEVGQSLICNHGTWSGSPTGSPTFTYAFINSANGQILKSGSSNTYSLSSADVGRAILCEVQATNPGGTGIVHTGVMAPIRPTSGVTGSTTSGSSGGGSTTVPDTGGGGNRPGADASSVTLGGTTIIVGSSGKASVRVVCRGSVSCHGKLTLTAKSSVQVKGKQTVRTVPIGTASFAIPAGGSRTIQIKLGPVGRGLLSSGHGRLNARLAIVKLEPAPRQSQVKTVQLVVQKGSRRGT